MPMTRGSIAIALAGVLLVAAPALAGGMAVLDGQAFARLGEQMVLLQQIEEMRAQTRPATSASGRVSRSPPGRGPVR